MTKAFLWADSGESIGFGHLTRSSVVAAELIHAGGDATVFTPDDRGVEYASAFGIGSVRAGGGFEAALSMMRDHEQPVILLDSYRLVTTDYAHARDLASVLVIFEDDPRNLHPCDVVVNGAPGAETLGYAPEFPTHLLLGARYFPLRQEFRNVPARNVRPQITSVVITVGGEDVHGILPTLAKVSLEAYPGAQITTIGPGGVPEYPLLVREADVIVCGAGQTLIEAVSTGAAVVALLLSDDQQHQHAGVVASGAALDGGRWSAAHKPDSLLQAALARLRDRSAREELAARGRSLVDGCGAHRIAEAVVACASRRAFSPPKYDCAN